jgi:hypothetical protein
MLGTRGTRRTPEEIKDLPLVGQTQAIWLVRDGWNVAGQVFFTFGVRMVSSADT